MRLQLREIINGRRLVTTENQEWGQRWLPGEAAGTVFGGCAQHHRDFQTVNIKSMRALTKRPETLDKLGIHWLLMNHILRPLRVHTSKPLMAIFNPQVPNICFLQGTSVWRVSFVSPLAGSSQVLCFPRLSWEKTLCWTRQGPMP